MDMVSSLPSFVMMPRKPRKRQEAPYSSLITMLWREYTETQKKAHRRLVSVSVGLVLLRLIVWLVF